MIPVAVATHGNHKWLKSLNLISDWALSWNDKVEW